MSGYFDEIATRLAALANEEPAVIKAGLSTAGQAVITLGILRAP